MIIQTVKTDVKKSHEFKTVNYGVSTDNLPLLFQMLRTNLYSDIRGSIIREICSNVIDSHTEAGKPDAIGEVEWIDYNRLLGVDAQLIIRDFGVGLSQERMTTIYGNYLSSTKRDSNDAIGGFGLGSKVPFAYTDSFFVKTVYNGIEYKYLCYVDESQLGAISLLEQSATTRQNGTEIIIPVKNAGDKSRFEVAIKTQLAYFKNFRYINIQGPETKVTFENEDCVVSTGHPIENLHIVLGNVTYPIDCAAIGITSYSLDYNGCYVGLKFKIGELQPTLSREGLFWNEVVKQKVLKKLERAKACIRKEIEKELDSEKDYAKWYVSVVTRKVKNFGDQWYFSNVQDKAVFTTSSGNKISISNRLEHWFVGLTLKLVTPYRSYRSSKKLKQPDYSISTPSVHNLSQQLPIYRYSGTLSARKSLQIFETSPDGYIAVSDTGIEGVSGILNPDVRYEESLKWLASLPDYDSIVVPDNKYDTTSDDDYKEAYKRLIAQRKLEGKFTAKKLHVTSNWGADYNMTLAFGMFEGKFEDEKKGIVIYGTQEQHKELLKAAAMLSPNNHLCKSQFKDLRVYKISQINTKHFKLLKNAYDVSDFLNGRTPLNEYVVNIHTAILLGPQLKDYQLLSEFGVVDQDMYKLYKEVSDFCKINGDIKYFAQNIVTEVENFVKTYKLENSDILEKFNKIQSIFEKAKLLGAITSVSGVEEEIFDYLKGRGLRVIKPEKSLVVSE